ncbi:rhamnan synthesis F family protein [Agrococcus sp. TSP3-2-1]|uniref:rhamnan synthesis F family protein n=1 Tax=Agrococcus sp. TSP3-2-1 TaxID=2804583 RepID=UPI003CEB1097
MRLDSPRRALVFAFHDVDGIVDDAYLAYVGALVAVAGRSIVVVNGELGDEGRARLEALGTTVLQRSNEGYDIWAFKTGIDALGEHLGEVDELLVANSSVFGPVSSLSDALATMDARDVDFWGMTRHAPIGGASSGRGRAPRAERAHVQSYFTAFRSSVLRSEAFRAYWRDLPPIRDYADAVQAHEMVMTGYFEDAGFSWDTLVDTRDLEPFAENPLIAMAPTLLDRGCPVFKRRLLYVGAGGLLAHTSGSVTKQLWQRLREVPGVDIDALERHAARTMRSADLDLALQDFVSIDTGPADPPSTVAAVVLPGPLAQQQAAGMVAAGVRTVLLARDGDALPSVEGAEVVRTGSRAPRLALPRVDAELLYVLPSIDAPRHEADARIAFEHTRQALGWDREELGRVARAFRESALLGMVLAPPSPARNFYGGIGGAKPERRLAELEAACAALGVDARALADAVPGAGLWIRRAAAEQWVAAVEAIPAAERERAERRLEPHDWLAIMTAVLPRLGWRVRRGISRDLAETLAAVSGAAYAGINRAAGAVDGEGLEATLARVDQRAITATVFFDVGPGFAHATSRSFERRSGGALEVRVRVPEDALGVRFDPLEGAGALVEGLAIEPAELRIVPLNGTRSRGVDLFASHDPAYVISGPAAGREIVIRAERVERITVDASALELIERRYGAGGPVARARHLAMRAGSKAVRRLRRRG